MSRYEVGGAQGAYQPGSGGAVLANKLGITDPDEMADAELSLLLQLYRHVLHTDFPEGPLTWAHLSAWHRLWLGSLYDWAGEQRSVNMSKGDFHFAVAGQIPSLLNKFERNYLVKLAPCAGMEESALVDAIAVVHVEFILIHPFREGNGRLSRLLADVMAVQAGYEPLDYSPWDRDKPLYFGAIQMGLGCDYEPMQRLVAEALRAAPDQ